jgi:hypothetical protein
MISPSAARFPQGQYFSRYRFRISLTGDTEYVVSGFQSGSNSQVPGPSVYGVCATGAVTIEILEYETGQLTGFSGSEPIFSNICTGPACAQCWGNGGVYGWGFDFYYEQSNICGCSPLP